MQLISLALAFAALASATLPVSPAQLTALIGTVAAGSAVVVGTEASTAAIANGILAPEIAAVVRKRQVAITPASQAAFNVAYASTLAVLAKITALVNAGLCTSSLLLPAARADPFQPRLRL